MMSTRTVNSNRIPPLRKSMQVFADSGLNTIFLPKSITTNNPKYPSFDSTCLENLSKIGAFFQNEVKNEDLIACECVVQEGAELSECPAVSCALCSLCCPVMSV